MTRMSSTKSSKALAWSCGGKGTSIGMKGMCSLGVDSRWVLELDNSTRRNEFNSDNSQHMDVIGGKSQ